MGFHGYPDILRLPLRSLRIIYYTAKLCAKCCARRGNATVLGAVTS